jgi:predicted TIM-barrel fold metal-dependent hydrolase
MFDSDTANESATAANEILADLVRRHPDRFAGLACFAPQSPKRTVREMEHEFSTAFGSGQVEGLFSKRRTNIPYCLSK